MDHPAHTYRNAYLFRSSAGSGKTFTLTKAYLKLVLQNPDQYKNILAITFTNDAKDEMKNRVLVELEKIALNRDTEMLAQIRKDFENAGLAAINQRLPSLADVALKNILHNYALFSISTIDHFFSKIIKFLAYEIGLNVNFQLETDESSALQEAMADLFIQASKNELDYLKDFAIGRLADDKDWNIRKDILELGNKLFKNDFKDIEHVLAGKSGELPNFISQLRQTISGFKSALKRTAEQGVKAASIHSLTLSDFSYKEPLKTMMDFANEKEKWPAPPQKRFNSRVEYSTWHRKDDPKAEIIRAAYDAGMHEAFETIYSLFQGSRYKDFLAAKNLLKHVYAYGVLSALARHLKSFRKEKNLLFLSDITAILRSVIGENEMPFIFEKLGAIYQHILIDEFQDTSEYQWKNLLPLIKHALSADGSLIIVGDIKQSIYRWRGGNFNLLLHGVEQDIPIPEKHSKALPNNYRSTFHIVEFNNAFFNTAFKEAAHLLGLEEYTSDYVKAFQDVTQKVIKKEEGYVEVSLLEPTIEQKWNRQAEDKTINTIHRLQKFGHTLDDILILTRKTSEASEMNLALSTAGITCISDEGLKVSASPLVKMILAAFGYIVNPEDRLSISEFNYFFSILANQEVLFQTSPGEFLERLKKWQERTVFEAVEGMMMELQVSQKNEIYLQKFLDICLDQSLAGNNTLALFLKWWKTQLENKKSSSLSITIGDDLEAVKVMTIHKSKGLESPVVIIPYADSSLGFNVNTHFWTHDLPEKYKQWGSLPLPASKELKQTEFRKAYDHELFEVGLESMNLYYVAFTRAIDKLYVFTKKNSSTPHFGKILQNTFQSNDFALNKHFLPEKEQFVFGSESPETGTGAGEKYSGSQPLLYQLKHSEIGSKIDIETRTGRVFLHYNSETSHKVKEGLLLHEFMAQLKNLDSIEKVCAQLASKHMLDKKVSDSLKSTVLSLFEQLPQIKPWYGSEYQVFTERKLFVHGATCIPDRVMTRGDEAIILDYKREKESPKHHKQVLTYASAMISMGFRQVSAYLLYMEGYKLVQVR